MTFLLFSHQIIWVYTLYTYLHNNVCVCIHYLYETAFDKQKKKYFPGEIMCPSLRAPIVSHNTLLSIERQRSTFIVWSNLWSIGFRNRFRVQSLLTMRHLKSIVCFAQCTNEHIAHNTITFCCHVYPYIKYFEFFFLTTLWRAYTFQSHEFRSLE